MADDRLKQIEETLSALGAVEGRRLLEEAVAEARAEVKDLVKDILKKHLLDQVIADARSGSAAQEATPSPRHEPPPPPIATAPIRSQHASRQGVYVYGVMPVDNAQTSGIVPLEEGSELGTVEVGGLAAVVSHVPLDIYGDDMLPERLNDPAWLEEKARAHERVLEALLPLGPVVPLRFCTIFLSRDNVAEMLDARRKEFESTLERVAGRSEWGVKVYCDDGVLLEALKGRVAGNDDAPPGRAYLVQKQQVAQQRKTLEEGRVRVGHDIYASLSPLAEEGVVLPVRTQEGVGTPVLSASFLLQVGGEDRFLRKVSELEETFAWAEVVFEITGPWPAYHFAHAR